MTIQSAVIGVNYQDFTRSGIKSNPMGSCIMFGSALQGTDKRLIQVPDLATFDSLFGNTSASRKHIQTFFLEGGGSSGTLYFFKVNTGATAATAADFTAGINAVDPLLYNGGVVIAPELYESFTIANRKAFFDAAEVFCDFNKGSMWVHLVDINPSTNPVTEADVVSEKNTNFNSAMAGFSYYGIGFRDINNVSTKVLCSPAIAAELLNLWVNRQFFRVPSNMAISSISSLQSVFRNYDTIVNAGVNPIVSDDGIKVFSGVGGNNKVAFRFINSVVCYKMTAFRCAARLAQFSNYTVAGEEDLILTATTSLSSELTNCWKIEKLLYGTTAAEAYKVTADTVKPDPKTSEIAFTIDLQPAYTNQKVSMRFVNVLGQ